MNRRDFLKTSALIGSGIFSGKNLLSSPVSPSGKPYNVLFVMTDQWRAHAMGYRNQDPVQTPYLDQFKNESITFDNAIASTPVCGPNRSCWLTGRYHQNHGMMKNEATHVNPEQLLSRVFKKNGYRNGYIGKWHLSGKKYPRNQPTPEFLRSDYDFWYRTENHAHFKLTYDDHGTMKDSGDGWQPDHETDKAIEFLKQEQGRPFNLVVSYGPPHNGAWNIAAGRKKYTPGDLNHKKHGYGYYAPKEYDALYKDMGPEDIRANITNVPHRRNPKAFDTIQDAISGYYGACTAIDDTFGRLIRFLKTEGLYENTIVVFTSDHGEMLGSHGFMTKGVCFEESINVPLMIHIPGQEGRMDNRLFNSVDVVPTLLGLTGQKLPAGIDGKDFSKSLTSMKNYQLDPEMAYIGYAFWRGWRTKQYTYVTTSKDKTLGGRESVYLKNKIGKSASHLLFDNKNDPYQQEPILMGQGKYTNAVIDDFHYELFSHLKNMGESIKDHV
tara:strand:- start:128 stop:1615 length:1488 start_codon:yes stop_codon:yes gene_type:complete